MKANADSTIAPRPIHDRRAATRRRQSAQADCTDGHQSAKSEFPQAGKGREERCGRVGVGLHHRGHERSDHRNAQDNAQPPPKGVGAREAGNEEEDCRVDQVELLFDRERPIVLQHRRGQLGGQIVGAG